MKKQNKKKSHKKKEDLKAEKQENISEKSRRKNNIIDKNKDIEEITEDNYETSTVMEFITGNNFFNILTFKLTTYLSNFKSRDFFIQPSVLQNLLAQKKKFLIPLLFCITVSSTSFERFLICSVSKYLHVYVLNFLDFISFKVFRKL